MAFTATQLPIEGTLPSLGGAIEWLNTQPLNMTQLHGKVLLVEFWTYTCINWRRTLPYVRAWADKYKDQGLVVIGVHTPEFGFEKNVANVRRAVKEIGITFPVAIDSDYVIWGAFKNQYWPAIYIVDAQGRIRHHQFGEGGYEQSERVIQRLLVDAGHGAASQELVSVRPAGVEGAADWVHVKSPETYLGYERSESFVSTGGALLDTRHVLCAGESAAQRVGPCRGLVGGKRFSGSERGQRAARVPLSRPRCQFDHGSHGRWRSGSIPRADRWQRPGCRARSRR